MPNRRLLEVLIPKKLKFARLINSGGVEEFGA
jgi:hypothetical protein